MTIRYPNGNQFRGQPVSSGTSNDSIDFSNRGMTLEDEINKSNQYYLREGIAVIHKKPTPIQIVSVDYPKRSAARIKEAYFRRASTTDYNGVYHGKYIDFDAKETKNKTSFPLKKTFMNIKLNICGNALINKAFALRSSNLCLINQSTCLRQLT